MIRSLVALPLLLLAPTQPDWPHAEAVTVSLSNFDFAPAELELKAGQTYRLHLENKASGGHNFAAEEFFRAATIDPEDGGLVKDGKVEVRAGGSADVRFVAPAAGDYALKCTHFLHSSFGMKGTIHVR